MSKENHQAEPSTFEEKRTQEVTEQQKREIPLSETLQAKVEDAERTAPLPAEETTDNRLKSIKKNSETPVPLSAEATYIMPSPVSKSLETPAQKDTAQVAFPTVNQGPTPPVQKSPAQTPFPPVSQGPTPPVQKSPAQTPFPTVNQGPTPPVQKSPAQTPFPTVNQGPTSFTQNAAGQTTQADPARSSKNSEYNVPFSPENTQAALQRINKDNPAPPVSFENTQAALQRINKDNPALPMSFETTQAALKRIRKDNESAAPLSAESTQAALKRISREPKSMAVATGPKYTLAAQKQNNTASKTFPGTNNDLSLQPSHDARRLLKLHWKRKNLRQTQARYTAHQKMTTKWIWFIPSVCAALLVILLTGSLITYYNITNNATQAQYKTQITTLADILPKDNLKMYDGSNHLLYQATDQGVQTTEPLDQISRNFWNAEIDTEDQTFWSNQGFDITGIVRAAINNTNSGQVVGGGSTITQQLIKEAIVGSSTTAQRKLEEIEIAPQLTRVYTKQQILSMYLNTTYYANGTYGAEAAAQVYFGLRDKPNNPASNQLDIAQSALLAGIPSNPTLRDPIAYPKNSLARTQEVLGLMYTLKTITNEQYQSALLEIKKPGFATYHTPAQSSQSLALSSFTVYALSELASDMKIKIGDLSRSGLIVTTTVNPNLQVQVLKEAQTDIGALTDQYNIHDSSVVMINPRTGAIETLIGNIDPAHNNFNVATQGLRQSGSTMKAFTYALAFENGVSPGEKTNDKLETFYYDGVSYRPDNYGGKHYGIIPYRKALAWSLNIDAVRLELSPYVGVQNDYNLAENAGLGVTNGDLNETFTLGALGVHLLNETSAFGTFANGGVHMTPHAINTVKNIQGKVLYTASTKGKRALSAQASYIVTDVLADTSARDGEFLACNALDLYVDNVCGGTIIPGAVKTGTTNDFKDNLTIGYTPNLVTGVWSGNDDNSAMSQNIIGITGAGTIWHDAMMTALQGQDVQQFVNPGGVVYSSKYGDLIKAN